MSGFVPADGTGDNGVLVVLEAAGEDEAAMGVPTVGKAGYFLWQNLKRVGINREGFRIHNVLSCRPPNNQLAGFPYEAQVIAKCAPNLDRTIFSHIAHAQSVGRTPVIITLGKIAVKRVMGDELSEGQMKLDYICYPLWNNRYKCWVIAADHPSYLMRGKTELLPVMQFAFQRALEIAEHGLKLDAPKVPDEYLLDPNLKQFEQWVEEFEQYLAANPDSTYLSYDIETPHKKGSNEEDLDKDEDDYTILQCSFSYIPGKAASAQWSPQNIPLFRRVFASKSAKLGWNSQAYDDPRILAQMPINGTRYDAMQMWHVLNSALPKGLGFVTPFYVPTTSLWKYLGNSSTADPLLVSLNGAFYNAKDADMALRNFLGIRTHLIESNLWDVYEKHMIQVHRVFNYMSEKGVFLDLQMRKDAEDKLTKAITDLNAQMEAVVPSSVKNLKVFKKTPKSTDGLIQVEAESTVTECPKCGEQNIKASHFKSVGKKKLTTCTTCGLTEKKHINVDHTFAGMPENPCVGLKARKVLAPTMLWASYEPFKLSKKSLLLYQKVLKHKAIVDRKKNKVTFDEKAILQLVKRYPNDKLYPVILEFRGMQKLLGTYIGVTQETGRIKGGLPTGADGRVHTLFTSNPSTLRSASQNPNLQNIPRPRGKDDPASIIRNLFAATPGNMLLARDYSGIEAKLVGYFARAPHYMRLCAIDVHSFYTAYALRALDGRVSEADLPQLSWSDADLKECLGGIKSRFKAERNNLYKHLVHAINFGQKAKGAQEKILSETGIAFPIDLIQRVMDLYKELFPEIPIWHQNVLLEVEKNGFLRNPFGYQHRFSRPFEYERVDGDWVRKQGSDANKCWAFLPQSSAAGIIKEAMLRLYFNRFDEAGQYLRLLIHDELFLEVPSNKVDEIDAILTEEMERPIEAMPLQKEWGMGEFLVVGTEAKRGERWGIMK
jgi:uracil-DNA glycosylase family 4